MFTRGTKVSITAVPARAAQESPGTARPRARALLSGVLITILAAGAAADTQSPVSFSVNGPTDPQMDALPAPGIQLFNQPWAPPPTPQGPGPFPFMRTTVQIAKAMGLPTPWPGDVNDYYVFGIDPLHDLSDGEIFQSEPAQGPAGPPVSANNQILKAVALGLLPDFANVNAYTFGQDYFPGDIEPINGGEEVWPNLWSWGGRVNAPAFNEPVVMTGTQTVYFYFSVDTWAIGLTNTAVQGAATLQGTLTLPAGPPGSVDPGAFGGPWLSDGEAAGDVFYALPMNAPGMNYLDHDDAALALQAPRLQPPPPPPHWMTTEDDIDALEHVGPGAVGESGNTHDCVQPTMGSNGGVHPPDVGEWHNPNHDPQDGVPIIFSVDRGSGGTVGSAVYTQVWDPNECASGDLFLAVTVPPGSPSANMTTNLLLIDEGQLGLMPHDDVDAVTLQLQIDDGELQTRIANALANFDPQNGSTGYGFELPLLGPNEAIVAFSVDNASMGLALTAVDYESRIDGMGMAGGSGVMEQGGDVFLADLIPPIGMPNAHPHVDLGTGLQFGQNYLWFEENILGLDRGSWALTAVDGQLNKAPDELNALDSTDAPPRPADLDGNGVVNAVDLAQLLGVWGPNPGHPADLNADGLVNAADLALLLGDWG